MYIKKRLLAILFSTALLHAQSSIGININNDEIETFASVNMDTLADYANGTAYMLDMSYLHTPDGNIGRIGFYGRNALQGAEGFTLGFGVKAAVAKHFFALPLMAKVSFTLPLNDRIPTTSINSSYAFAPTVLSFADAKRYSDFKLEASMEVISNIHIFTGYRSIITDYNTYDKLFNDSFYGGLKLSF